MKFYNFLFLKSYKLAINLGNEGFYPEVNAWFLATLLPWLNVFSVLKILKSNSLISNDFFRLILICSSVFWVISYIYCMRNDKYLEILSSQEKLISTKKYTNVWFGLYALITGAIYFIYLND